MLAIVMCVALVAAGCGTKNAEQVVKDLDHVIGKLDSYQGAGKMTLQTGQQAQEYNVEVWYKNPHYYRIALTNEAKDITQIVLRNDEGVFVLTPHLNKMFRFQSDWPENSGQVYLYQSLVQSIVMDNERQFAQEKDMYVFDVAANYQNGLLSRQKIWLNKKDYAPKQVQVSDENNNVMVSVNFSQFEFGKKFDKDSFDMQRNMTSWNIQSLPTTAKVGDTAKQGAVDATAKQGTTAAGTNKSGTSGTSLQQTTASDKAAAAKQSFGIVEPNYLPKGVKKQDMKEVKLGDDKGILFRYSGAFNYTLIETMPQAKTVTSLPGDIVDLGYTLGVVTGEEKGMRTLTWTYDGIEYRLSTGDLPPTEMIRVAQSVQGQVGK
jgi:outer membrane lipoprotein-sorting protein